MRSWFKNPFARDPNAQDPTIIAGPSEKARPRRHEKLPFGAKCYFDPFDPLQYPTDKRPVTVAGYAPPPPTPEKPPGGLTSPSPSPSSQQQQQQGGADDEGFAWDGEVDESSPASPTAAAVVSPAATPNGEGFVPNAATATNSSDSPIAVQQEQQQQQQQQQRHYHHHHTHTETEEQLIVRLKKERLLVDQMMAKMGLTAPEDEQQRFKLELELLRFVRARKYDVDRAIEQYQNMLKFRADNKVDEMWDTAFDPLGKYFQNICPHRNIGFDFEGHPVYYERTGVVKVPELLKYMTDGDPTKRHVRHLEHISHRMQYLSWRHGRNITKCVIVQDIQHLSYNPDPSAIRVFKATANVDQTFYPERLHKIFLINAPMSFRAVWATIKVFVDHNTRQKIEILGANYRDRLRQVIPLDQLPTMYGGELELVWPNGDGCLPNVRSAEAEDGPEDWMPILLREGEPLPEDAEPIPPHLQ